MPLRVEVRKRTGEVKGYEVFDALRPNFPRIVSPTASRAEEIRRIWASEGFDRAMGLTGVRLRGKNRA